MVTLETTADTAAGNIEWVPISKIRTDHEVNTRPIDFGWVDKHVNSFDPDKLGVPIVSARDDGTFVCIDGQNRLEICRRVGWGDQDIQCRVFRGLTKAQEATLFLGHNDSRQVGTFHRFAARITAGDPDAIYIAAIVQRAGWELSFTASEKKIAAVGALEAVWKSGRPDETGWRGHILEATLGVVTEAWGYSADAVNGQILRGVGAVVARHAEILDKPALARKLTQHRNGALGVLSDAHGLHGYAGGTVAACVAETVVRIYNSHRKGTALPPWRQDRGTD
jgi:hypothetical protein